ncbi:MAG TPA: hypothetical protein VEY51_12240 [Chondromyces sp.]|nr:hypothetical protein [Chondromyces sp.]
MPGYDNETFTEYKKLEEEWNTSFKEHLNSRLFVVLASALINCHLDQVEYKREIVKSWLDSNQLANRDEIAELTKTQILIESKVDDYDDLIYIFAQKWHSRRNMLDSLEQLMLDLQVMLNEEYREGRNNKIKSLKEELMEVKSLFY